jgi:hypothetical protein
MSISCIISHQQINYEELLKYLHQQNDNYLPISQIARYLKVENYNIHKFSDEDKELQKIADIIKQLDPKWYNQQEHKSYYYNDTST